MNRLGDQQYLLGNQYRSDANLSARITMHERFSVNTHGWHAWLFDRLSLAPHARILELGCGTGALWQTNAGRIDPAWDITLSDFSEGMLASARSRLGPLADSFTWAVIDAQEIPFLDATFDIVIANHMLYHVPDRDLAISEIRRVLRPTGTFYAATNGQSHIREMDDLLHTVAPAAERNNDHDTFGLESAPAQLMRHFSDVTLHFYPDALAVTDPDAVIQYLLSTPAVDHLDPSRIDEIHAHVSARIATRGSFHVTKSSGLFVSCP